MKKEISMLLAITMMTATLTGYTSNVSAAADSSSDKQSADSSVTVKTSPDKYTWYIKFHRNLIFTCGGIRRAFSHTPLKSND